MNDELEVRTLEAPYTCTINLDGIEGIIIEINGKEFKLDKEKIEKFLSNFCESQNTNRTLLRLEDKLIDLGYMQDFQNQYIYWKQFNVCDIIAGLTQDKKECWLRLTNIDDIETKKDMKELKKVFNVMKQDLEELKKYES